MDASEITFGCEFEVTLPAAAAPAIGGYHNGIQIPRLPDGWNAQRDGSIRADAGFVGVEIVSPILKGADGIRQIQTVCEWLASKGAKVNQSTGFHVHVGFDRNDKAGLKRLVAMVANHELAIYASTGTKSRQTGHYCKPVRSSEEAKRIYDCGLPGYTDRYHLLNLANLAARTRPTVEFRAFAGTTNATKAIGYIRMCIGIVERATSETRGRKFGRKYPESMTGGVDAVRRLFKFLGWAGGARSPKVYGNIEVEGGVTIEEIKGELVRLARKYDSAAE